MLFCVNICWFDLLQTVTSMEPPACRFSLKVPHLLAWPSGPTLPVEVLVQYQLDGKATLQEERRALILPRPWGTTSLQKRVPFTANLNTRFYSVRKGLEMYILSKLQSVHINSFENIT